jgi:hypothetical protein
MHSEDNRTVIVTMSPVPVVVVYLDRGSGGFRTEMVKILEKLAIGQ